MGMDNAPDMSRQDAARAIRAILQLSSFNFIYHITSQIFITLGRKSFSPSVKHHLMLNDRKNKSRTNHYKVGWNDACGP
jgi:hypothetical protein